MVTHHIPITLTRPQPQSQSQPLHHSRTAITPHPQTQDELVATEAVFRGLLAGLAPEEAVALMSALVFQVGWWSCWVGLLSWVRAGGLGWLGAFWMAGDELLLYVWTPGSQPPLIPALHFICTPPYK